jgi:hypothetical protein
VIELILFVGIGIIRQPLEIPVARADAVDLPGDNARCLPHEFDLVVDADLFHDLENKGRRFKRQCAAFKIVTLAPKAGGVAAGRALGFKDGDLVPFASEKIACGQAAHPRSDDDDLFHLAS